jgi:hypothetical protein
LRPKNSSDGNKKSRRRKEERKRSKRDRKRNIREGSRLSKQRRLRGNNKNSNKTKLLFQRSQLQGFKLKPKMLMNSIFNNREMLCTLSAQMDKFTKIHNSQNKKL